jgi:alkylated DNA nucleotide flippase Atl1
VLLCRLTAESRPSRRREAEATALAQLAQSAAEGTKVPTGAAKSYARQVQVRETNLKQLVQGEKQFRVPLWQRQYTWRRADHRLLWRDILEQYARSSDDKDAGRAGHFLGSIVLSPVPSAASGVASYLIVDGQQRLTTLMLLLASIRDAAAGTDPRAIERFDELYLINKFQQGEARFRLVPTQADRVSFFACIERAARAGGQDPIGQAYRFFRSHVELLGPLDEPLDLNKLTTIVVERLAVVDITTGPGDNAHRIFQSLNATGVNLTQADLLRNLIFMLLPTRASAVYDGVWRPMERLVGFDNLEGLARVDLQRRGIDVAVDDVFRRHQERLEALAGREHAIEDAVRDLALRAGHYKQIIDPTHESDGELRLGLLRLRRWGAQTSHPILMVAYDLRERGLLSIEGMREAVSYIESFLVRRQLAGIPANALNRLFVQIVEHLPQDETFPSGLRAELSQPRRYWPGDAQLREAIRTRPFYLSGRSLQRRLILERLEQSFGHPEQVDFEVAGLTIEHVMPQTLSQEWRDHLAAAGEDPDEVHQSYVHTLGNLTLTAFNGTLSNNPFERKRQIYSGSHLELNRALADHEAWGRDEILERADDLADRAIAIWPGPVPGTGGLPADFDWRKINAAIAAIPLGRWTTYGDLAQLGGTAAMPVGQHVANSSGLDNAYRVLGADGKPRPDFRWTDSADTRDVSEVLAADGVQFRANGAAEPSQRISASELASLIDVLDDDSIDADDGSAAGLAGRQEWDWERYSAELGIPDDKLAVSRALVEGLSEVIAEMGLPWHMTFRKGYVGFQRSGGYNTLLVDMYWRKAPRLAVKLPARPEALALQSPYPDIEESWYEDEREWGWTLDPVSAILPDLRPAVTIAERFHPTMGPTRDAVDRELVREQLRGGMTPQQIFETLGQKRVHWLTAIEEEARLQGELAAFPATPENASSLRDRRQLRWERIAARIFGDANRVAEVRRLYDQQHGPDASSRTYTGRGRRFPDMENPG